MTKPHPTSKKHPSRASHTGGAAHAIGLGAKDGSARLAECYLRVLQGYTGADTTLKAQELANNAWEPRDEEATHRVLRQAHRPDLPAHAPTRSLIEALKQVSRDQLHQMPLAEDAPGVAEYEQLLEQVARDAAARKAGLSASQWRAVAELHPLQRTAAIEAIQDLKAARVAFRITEAYRPPAEQDDLVRRGESYAPEGYSLHGIGLALDIVPTDRRGAEDWNAPAPRWRAIDAATAPCGFTTVGEWDRPHHQTEIDARRAVRLPTLPSGWKMLPIEQLPGAVQAEEAAALEVYRLRRILAQATAASEPRAEHAMPADATRAARPVRPMLRQP